MLESNNFTVWKTAIYNFIDLRKINVFHFPLSHAFRNIQFHVFCKTIISITMIATLKHMNQSDYHLWCYNLEVTHFLFRYFYTIWRTEISFETKMDARRNNNPEMKSISVYIQLQYHRVLVNVLISCKNCTRSQRGVWEFVIRFYLCNTLITV